MVIPKVWNERDETCPTDAVYVGRPTKWGNPYKISKYVDREMAVASYRAWIMTQAELLNDAKTELKGKHLVCWCAPKPCHADVLLEIANS